MSEIVDVSDVQYIHLETIDRGLLSWMVRLQVQDDAVFMSEYVVSKVFKLGRNGKLLGALGQNEQGPGEYKVAMDFVVIDSLIYLPITDRYYTLIYNVNNGSYKSKIPNESFTQYVAASKDKKLICYRNQFCSTDNFFSFYILNQKGDSLYKEVPEVDNEKVDKDKWFFYYHTSPVAVSRERVLLYEYTPIYSHIAEEYLQDWRNKTVKYPEKREQLCKLLSEMKDDDNPILVLYKKK